MNCELFQTIAADLARDEKRGLMEAGVRAGARAHVADCEHCAQTLVDQNSLSEGLRSLSENMKGWQAPAAVEGQLLAAFRDQVRVAAVASPSRRWRYWAGAAAAMLLVGFGLWALSGVWGTRSNNGSTPAPVAQLDAKSVPPVGVAPPTVAPAPVMGFTPIKVSAPRNLPSRRSSLKLAAKHGPATPAVAPLAAPAFVETVEVATDFVPVGYGSAFDLQDGGQLVRVELPRVALARFGLPMNMDRADERIKADVLVGADGLARAIRFVK